MANTVCITNDFDTDENGRLEVAICGDPPSRTVEPCDDQMLRRDADCGLYVPRNTRLIRMTASRVGVATAGGAGPVAGLSVLSDRLGAGRVTDNGSLGAPIGGGTEPSLPLWAIQADGSLTIECEGVYHFSVQTICYGGGRVIGGQARIFINPLTGAQTDDIIATEDYRVVAPVTFDMASGNDGPEYNASAVRFIPAGTNINYRGFVYTPAGQNTSLRVSVDISYLGGLA